MKSAILAAALLATAGVGVAHGQTLEDIRKVVAEARRLQTPAQALHAWGDPDSSKGAVSPTLHFLRPDVGFVDLKYGPPAKHPRRLEWLRLFTRHAEPPIDTDTRFRAWFGKPVRQERGDFWLGFATVRLRWVYDARDTARLRLLSIYGFEHTWPPHLRAREPSWVGLEFDPAP